MAQMAIIKIKAVPSNLEKTFLNDSTNDPMVLIMALVCDFDSAKLVSFKLEECACGEELSTLRRQHRGHEDELIVVYSLSAIVRL